jgi:hypothetical protein
MRYLALAAVMAASTSTPAIAAPLGLPNPVGGNFP